MTKQLEKYIGIKQRTKNCLSSNVGLIFEEQEDGSFLCKKNNHKITKADILHDLQLGYLKPFKESSNLVVHCKREPYQIYIGRERTKYHFGNPFSHKENSLAEVTVETAEDACEQFRKWVEGEDWKELDQERRQWILDNLKYLKGKTLGCWCKVKGHEFCHGDVLVELVNKIYQ